MTRFDMYRIKKQYRRDLKQYRWGPKKHNFGFMILSQIFSPTAGVISTHPSSIAKYPLGGLNFVSIFSQNDTRAQFPLKTSWLPSCISKGPKTIFVSRYFLTIYYFYRNGFISSRCLRTRHLSNLFTVRYSTKLYGVTSIHFSPWSSSQTILDFRLVWDPAIWESFEREGCQDSNDAKISSGGVDHLELRMVLGKPFGMKHTQTNKKIGIRY